MRPRLACDVVQATWIEDQHGFADEVLPESEKLRDQQWRVGLLVFVEYGDGILIFGNADDLEITGFRRIRSEYGEILLSRIQFVEWPTKAQIVGEKPFKAIDVTGTEAFNESDCSAAIRH